jgi:hypothetical protein
MMSAVEVVREWKRRNRAGDLAALAQGLDLDRYTEQCLGLTGWTTGYDIARGELCAQPDRALGRRGQPPRRRSSTVPTAEVARA